MGIKARFFLYNKKDGSVVYFNTEPPINDYIAEGKTVHVKGDRARGINWDNVSAVILDEQVEVDTRFVYTYSPDTGELTQGVQEIWE